MGNKKKPVTLNQALAVMNMGNEKGVGRDLWQEAMDNGSFARFLDCVRSGLVDIVPPPGARIRVIRARVNQGRDWKEAVDAVGPDTMSIDEIYKPADLYPPTSQEETEKDYILLSLPDRRDGYHKALTWAQIVGLKPTVPREVFAIGEQYPNLDQTFGENPLTVVATTDKAPEGFCQACLVWWDCLRGRRERGANFLSVNRVDDSSCWYAFCK